MTYSIRRCYWVFLKIASLCIEFAHWFVKFRSASCFKGLRFEGFDLRYRMFSRVFYSVSRRVSYTLLLVRKRGCVACVRCASLSPFLSADASTVYYRRVLRWVSSRKP